MAKILPEGIFRSKPPSLLPSFRRDRGDGTAIQQKA
jgi:hypothetical protein